MHQEAGGIQSLEKLFLRTKIPPATQARVAIGRKLLGAAVHRVTFPSSGCKGAGQVLLSFALMLSWHIVCPCSFPHAAIWLGHVYPGVSFPLPTFQQLTPETKLSVRKSRPQMLAIKIHLEVLTSWLGAKVVSILNVCNFCWLFLFPNAQWRRCWTRIIAQREED